MPPPLRSAMQPSLPVRQSPKLFPELIRERFLPCSQFVCDERSELYLQSIFSADVLISSSLVNLSDDADAEESGTEDCARNRDFSLAIRRECFCIQGLHITGKDCFEL